jgi:hypothetical protein
MQDKRWAACRLWENCGTPDDDKVLALHRASRCTRRAWGFSPTHRLLRKDDSFYATIKQFVLSRGTSPRRAEHVCFFGFFFSKSPDSRTGLFFGG